MKKYVKDIIKMANDKQEIRIYEAQPNDYHKFITKGNWFQDNILNYVTSDKQFHQITVLEKSATELRVVVK